MRRNPALSVRHCIPTDPRGSIYCVYTYIIVREPNLILYKTTDLMTHNELRKNIGIILVAAGNLSDERK